MGSLGAKRLAARSAALERELVGAALQCDVLFAKRAVVFNETITEALARLRETMRRNCACTGDGNRVVWSIADSAGVRKGLCTLTHRSPVLQV